MKLAVDVDYHGENAIAAGILFSNWSDKETVKEYVAKIKGINEYIPGQFYRRELPCILSIIEKVDFSPNVIVIDGYVYLGKKNRAGLGKHLYDHLRGNVAVIGVAKKPFKGTSEESEVYRGNSKRPLYITAVGVELKEAKQNIVNMHGNNRVPTLLKRVNQICRQT